MAQSVSRFKLMACMVAGAISAVYAPAPAMAKKKAATTPAVSAPAPAASAPAAASATAPTGASQSADQERPKPVIDENQEAPASDENGNVVFSGAHSGKAKLVISGAAKENIKIYLEGRFFGTAPRTISGMPAGDYIVEGVFPDGKSVTKPVSLASEGEVVVELAPSDLVASATKDNVMPLEKAEKRWRTAEIIAISSVAVLIVGGVFGYLERTTQNDYNNKASSGAAQSQLDDLANKGNRYALAANVCFGLTGVGLITAAIIGYPAYKARKAAERPPESPETAPVSFWLAPTRGLDGGAATLALRF